MSVRFEMRVGPMRSGKSTWLIDRLERSAIAHKSVCVVKPELDTRTPGIIASRVQSGHDAKFRNSLQAVDISCEKELRDILREPYDVFGFDEVQFYPLDTPQSDVLGWFGRTIRDFILEHAEDENDIRIYAAGLDQDWAAMPFNCVGGLFSIAHDARKEAAVCENCGADAHYSVRVGGDSAARIQVGDADIYRPSCLRCRTILSTRKAGG